LQITPPQFDAAVTVLARILTMTQPADAVLSSYFRSNPKLGRQDRGFIAESVFGLLRRRYGLEFQTGATNARQLLLAYLSRIAGVSLRQLESLLAPADLEWAAALKVRTDAPPLNVAAELPQWLVEMLAAELPESEILALGRALQQPAPLDLRVNTMLTTRDAVLRQFADEGLAARATPYSPLGIRVEFKPSISRHPLFVGGKFEVQDEGSQILGQLLAPKRREMVVDFCAGAGGKTLMLGALMQSQGRLYAFDVSETRLNRFKPRLKRSGLSNVFPQRLNSENDIKVKRLAGKIDRVLVDAPCSGFGTLRRNPDLKWRQSAQSVAELSAKQSAILHAASQLLKPGGRLVYATCSFLRAENQNVVAAFLASHAQFRLLPANDILREQNIAIDTGEFLQLYPHRHACDGFFAAVLEVAP
jgi:16S rRNA (cytosine967-C5)-methyltransferase